MFKKFVKWVSAREEAAKKNEWLKLFWLILFFVVFIGGISFIVPAGKMVWGVVGVHIPYSEGERSVNVIKVSEKGWIWKTWEIETVLSQQGFSVTYVWEASIDNQDPNKEKILQDINAAFETGQTVKVRYEQKGGSVPWRSGTPCWIKEVIFPEQLQE